MLHLPEEVLVLRTGGVQQNALWLRDAQFKVASDSLPASIESRTEGRSFCKTCLARLAVGTKLQAKGPHFGALV